MSTTSRHIHHTTLARAHEYIAVRYDFNAGSLIGRGPGPGGQTELGELPVRFWAMFRDAETADDFYYVKSYITPIAWFAGGEWVVPEQSYSVTTSKHQAQVRRAIKDADREH